MVATAFAAFSQRLLPWGREDVGQSAIRVLSLRARGDDDRFEEIEEPSQRARSPHVQETRISEGSIECPLELGPRVSMHAKLTHF
jgi:hypothetical protein